MECERYCGEHQHTMNELNNCKNKISIFEALMKKIDEELVDIKKDIKKLSDKIELLQQKTSEMPLKIIIIAVGLGASVSTIITFLILLVINLTGVL